MELSEVFWISFITITSGLVLKCGSMCYKSKCKEVSFFGIKIIRDTEGELKEDELEINKVEMNKITNQNSTI